MNFDKALNQAWRSELDHHGPDAALRHGCAALRGRGLAHAQRGRERDTRLGRGHCREAGVLRSLRSSGDAGVSGILDEFCSQFVACPAVCQSSVLC